MAEFEDTEFDDGEEAENEPFPLEKVLTASLDEYTRYLELIGKSIRNYELVGVHISEIYSFEDDDDDDEVDSVLLEDFVENVPENAEVVIAFNDILSGAHESKGYEADSHKSIFAYRASGIALIPKPKKRHNPPINDEDFKP